MNNKKAQINTHTYPQTLPSPGFPILLTLIFPNATLVAKDEFPYHDCPRVLAQLHMVVKTVFCLSLCPAPCCMDDKCYMDDNAAVGT